MYIAPCPVHHAQRLAISTFMHSKVKTTFLNSSCCMPSHLGYNRSKEAVAAGRRCKGPHLPTRSPWGRRRTTKISIAECRNRVETWQDDLIATSMEREHRRKPWQEDGRRECCLAQLQAGFRRRRLSMSNIPPTSCHGRQCAELERGLLLCSQTIALPGTLPEGPRRRNAGGATLGE